MSTYTKWIMLRYSQCDMQCTAWICVHKIQWTALGITQQEQVILVLNGLFLQELQQSLCWSAAVQWLLWKKSSWLLMTMCECMTSHNWLCAFPLNKQATYKYNSFIMTRDYPYDKSNSNASHNTSCLFNRHWASSSVLPILAIALRAL